MPLRLVRLGLATGLILQLIACNDPHASSSPASNSIDATPSVHAAAAVVGAKGETVTVAFVSSDGRPISDLTVSDLGSLPSGWSGPASFGCGIVTTGSGCVLNLTYAPTAGASGTLDLDYWFMNSAGDAITGEVAIPYSATTSDNVMATASPTGQIAAVASDGTQQVTLTFTTDDGQSASNLVLTSSLGALPAGWSSTAQSFSCATVSTGNACQLSLAYAPTSAGGGILTLGYSYTDDAGEAKTGSANISFSATTDDNVVYTQSPSGQVNATVNGGGTAVTVTFTTDDGQPATGLSISSGLSSLPGAWSGPGSFSCATLSSGTGCRLALSYAPTTMDSGTLSLGYQYDSDSGSAKSGTVNISYAATAPHLYIPNLFSVLDECTLASDGSLSSCAATPASGGSGSPSGIAFDGASVYVTDFYAGEVQQCAVNADGSFSSCAVALSGVISPWALAINGSYLYITSDNTTGSTTYCRIGTGGALSSCASTASGTNLVNGIAVGGGYAYLSALNPPQTGYQVDVCTVNGDGSLTGCASTGSGFSDPQFITLSGGHAYIGNQQSSSVAVCSIGSGGTLASCANSAVGFEPNGVAIFGNEAYVTDDNDNIYKCTVGTGGSLGSCAASNGGTTFSAPQQIVIH